MPQGCHGTRLSMRFERVGITSNARCQAIPMGMVVEDPESKGVVILRGRYAAPILFSARMRRILRFHEIRVP